MIEEIDAFDQETRKNIERRAKESQYRVDDGLILGLVKLFSLPQVWYHNKVLCPVIVGRWLKPHVLRGVRFADDYGDDPAKGDRAAWRLAIDVYVAACGLILCGVYAIAFYSLQDLSIPCVESFLAVWAALFAFLRVYEIVAYESGYHSRDTFVHPAKTGEIIRTLWHYLEVIVAFGIFYFLTSRCFDDPFKTTDSKSPEFTSGLLNPVYFSFVTMSTLGYGDYAPQSACGKVFVFVEVMIGVFLLVVVLQRVISAQPTEKHSIRPRAEPGVGCDR